MARTPKIQLIRLRGRNQITLPTSVVEALSLQEDDYLAVVAGEEGIIRLRPAKLVTAGTEEAEKAEQRAEADLRAGRSVRFGSVKEFTDEMLTSHREQLEEMKAEEEATGRAATSDGWVVPAARERSDRTAMLVHVGANSTSVTILRDGLPIFTRDIELGMALPSLLLVWGLAKELRKTVEFFEGTIEGPGVGIVFLSAGPPPVEGLAKKIEAALGLEVRELSPLSKVAEEAIPSPEPFTSTPELDRFRQSINITAFLPQRK